MDETKRLFSVLETRLSSKEYLDGIYGLADIKTFPWYVKPIRSLYDTQLNAIQGKSRSAPWTFARSISQGEGEYSESYCWQMDYILIVFTRKIRLGLSVLSNAPQYRLV